MTRTPSSTLVLMDIENHTAADSTHVLEAISQIEAAGEVEPTARRIIASGGRFAATAMFDVASHYPSRCYSYRVGSGVDGADRKLLEDADPRRIAERHDRVVIASGDHCFAPLAADLIDLGIETVVVVRSGSLSSELYRSGARIVALRPLLTPAA
jgi:hypothetical protein